MGGGRGELIGQGSEQRGWGLEGVTGSNGHKDCWGRPIEGQAMKESMK